VIVAKHNGEDCHSQTLEIRNLSSILFYIKKTKNLITPNKVLNLIVILFCFILVCKVLHSRMSKPKIKRESGGYSRFK
jgi:hypothetical protein